MGYEIGVLQSKYVKHMANKISSVTGGYVQFIHSGGTKLKVKGTL